MTQEQKVYEILKEISPARTSQIAMACLREGIGVSATGRYCRWMRERGILRSFKNPGDKEISFEVIREYRTRQEWLNEQRETLFDLDKFSVDW